MSDATPEPGATPAASDDTTLFDLGTELGRDYAAVDWAATCLGAPDTWPGSLKNTVRLMISSRFAMWMAWGPDLVLFCNDAYRRDTLAAKYPWALGKRADEVWAEIWPDIGPRIDSVMRTGAATWDEGLLLFLERSGYVEETYHTFSYSPLTDDAGRIAGMLCVVSEDTGRVVSERRITTLRDLGSDLAGASTEAEVYAAAQRQIASDPYNMPFAVAYLLDADGATAKRAWTAGIEPSHPAAPETIDLSDSTAPWAADRPADGASRRIALAGRFARLPSGAWSDQPTHALLVPLTQPGGRHPYGFLIIALNHHRPFDDEYLGFLDLLTGQITAAVARARAYDAELRRAEQIAELDRAKTTFFTNVSHELRTPLTLLLGPAEDALGDDTLPVRQRQRVEVIHRNAERLLKLVNTLLDFSRLESGRMQTRYEPLDLARCTAEIASMFESAFSRAGLTLDVQCEPARAQFFVDREMWAKIVLNLLSNALKATFEGGVTVRLDQTGDGARLSVSDTGIGIPANEQEHLFERFHRVSGAALRSHEGSGIGLALVAELAQLHGGAVTVHSEVGAGTTFTVSIPAGADHLPAEHVSATVTDDLPAADTYGAGYLAEVLRWAAPDGQQATPTAAEGDDDRYRVLVADDNADMRGYIRDLLGDRYRVDTASDGAVALAAARQDPPDLVLTDVMMPMLDGFGLLAALRADPATAHVPVIMVSARSGEDAAVVGLESGADDYLVKPFSARELIARVRANLELDRARRLVEELERSRALLAQAEELALVGSYHYDIAADTVLGSAQFHRLLGGSVTDFASALSLVHPDDAARVEAAARASMATGAPLNVEVRLVDRTGAERTLWVSGVVTAVDGAPVHIRGSVQDVTEQRRGEQALISAASAREAEAREHAIAAELQRSLLPERSFDADHLDVATYYRAGVEGTEVGGDWYDAIELDAGRTALVLGDVMGRGVRAAAVMGQLRATVRAYARLDVPPDYLLHLLDSAVREISADTIVTAVYAVYDPADRTLVYANAGHLPPLLGTPGRGVQRLSAGGPPLGTGRTWAKPETVTLVPGATLTLYTDGLVEDRDSDIDDGIGRLAQLLGGESGPLDTLPDRLVAELRPDGHDDDIAVLVARVSERSSTDRFVSTRFEEPTEVARLSREFATDQLADWQLPADIVDDVELIVSELVTNALRHGRLPIELRLRCTTDRLFVDVHDSATASPKMRHAGPADDNGRGLQIVSALAERWGTRHTDTGKSVWCLIMLAGSVS